MTQDKKPRTTKIIDNISKEIADALRAQSVEEVAPSQSADTSDWRIKRMKEKVAKLRRIRQELEDEFASVDYPGY